MNNTHYALIGRKKYRITDSITLNIPTVSMIRGENADDETAFWREAGLFTRTPSQLMSELFDIGIDFEKITDYELFGLLLAAAKRGKEKRRGILFEEFSVWELVPAVTDGETVFTDGKGKKIIDRDIYGKISDAVRAVTGIKSPAPKKFGNERAKQMRIDQDRRTKARRTAGEKGSALDGIILRLVCNTNFPYSFETVGDVTIYDLIWGLKQIEKDNRVNELLRSRLAGNDISRLPGEELSRYVI